MDVDLRSGDMNNGKESTRKDNVSFINPDSGNRSGCLRSRSPDRWNSTEYPRFKNNGFSEGNRRFTNLDGSNRSGHLRFINLDSMNDNVYLRLKEIRRREGKA